MTRTQKKVLIELLIVFALFTIINIIAQITQEPTGYHEGAGVVGSEYYIVAQQFVRGEQPAAQGPYVYRIALPWLVAQLAPTNLLLGFKVINIVANAATVLLLTLWLSLFLPSMTMRLVLVILFLLQWHGPVRLIYYAPVYSDPPLFVFLLLGLLIIYFLRENVSSALLISLSFVVFVGALFREVVAILAIAVLFAQNPIRFQDGFSFHLSRLRLGKLINWPSYKLFLPLAAALGAIAIMRSVATPTNEYSFTSAAFTWAYMKPVLTYIHGWFVTFGPILVIFLYGYKSAVVFLCKHQYLLVYVLAFAVLGWIGGADTERILLWSMPVVYLLIGKAFDEHRALFTPLFLVVLLGCQLLSERIFWTYPEYPSEFVSPFPILTLLSSQVQAADLWSYHGSRTLSAISLLQYVLLTGAFLLYLQARTYVLRASDSRHKSQR